MIAGKDRNLIMRILLLFRLDYEEVLEWFISKNL